ncbi:type 4a pilus biogenesis protein PilO [Thiomonas intermedia]|uniref:type 4a pilus biogenesis protein PilO n=1 Tax=Thiomonas intermedia TaxID=926 RepID=UPI0009A4C1AD|nr:type 4a pilus biogenesis protein PilO [Thiomonas intermedia]
MASSKFSKIDLNGMFQDISAQFRGLNPNDPGAWPVWPRNTVYAVAFLLTLGLGWYAWLSGTRDELTSAQKEEQSLREQYRSKLEQAVSLDLLKAQKAQVQQYVALLEKQLPSKAEMDALLSDINQAGIGRGLQFELFKPGQVDVKPYYAELPISIKLQGGYTDLAGFATDIAKLSRIVTLNNISLTANTGKTGAPMVMDATAKTFRYLDADEIAAQAQKAKKPGGAK